MLDRDQAYREGYDTATRSLFSLASQVTGKLSATEPLSQTREMPPVQPMLEPRVCPPSPPRPYAVPSPSPRQIIERRAKRGRKGARHAA